jgi:hypothetical protein
VWDSDEGLAVCNEQLSIKMEKLFFFKAGDLICFTSLMPIPQQRHGRKISYGDSKEVVQRFNLSCQSLLGLFVALDFRCQEYILEVQPFVRGNHRVGASGVWSTWRVLAILVFLRQWQPSLFVSGRTGWPYRLLTQIAVRLMSQILTADVRRLTLQSLSSRGPTMHCAD